MNSELRALAAADNPIRELLIQPAADQLLAQVRDLLTTASMLGGGPGFVDLHQHDLVLINSSAGKDSQAMLSHLVALADAQHYPREHLVVVHADLGRRVEWPGTAELAAAQAAAYGLRYETVSHVQDLLDQVITRRARLDATADTLTAQAEALRHAGWERMSEIAALEAQRRSRTPAWMSPKARFCTSDQKTAQVKRLMTRLVDERHIRGHTGPTRILNCLGLRAAESRTRAKRTPLQRDPASNGRREVTRWFPIFEWTEAQVWATIRASGLPWHPAYDLGAGRLSCAFCIFGQRRDLILAARHNPTLARQYVAIEDLVGSSFTAAISMREIATQAGVLS